MTETNPLKSLILPETRAIKIDTGISKENLAGTYHLFFPEDISWKNYSYTLIDIPIMSEESEKDNFSFLVKRSDKPAQLLTISSQQSWRKSDLEIFGYYAIFSIAAAISDIPEFVPTETEVYLYVFSASEETFDGSFELCESKDLASEVGEVVKTLNVYILSEVDHLPDNEILERALSCFCENYQTTVTAYTDRKRALEELANQCIKEGIYPELFQNKREEFIENYMNLFTMENLEKDQEGLE